MRLEDTLKTNISLTHFDHSLLVLYLTFKTRKKKGATYHQPHCTRTERFMRTGVYIRFNILKSVSTLHTGKEIRRLKRRFLGKTNQHLLPRFIYLFSVCSTALFILKGFHRSSLSLSRNASSSDTNQGLMECLSAPVINLNSFDPYILSRKAKGEVENDIENRFQEDIWDTLVNRYTLFPAWSDMTWNIAQYARGLSTDLMILQTLAARLLGATPPSSLPHYPSYHSPSSPVELYYVHHRLDRQRGLQYAVNFNHRNAAPDHHTRYNLLVEKSLDVPQCRVSFGHSTISEPVYILLPYKGREQRLRLFLQNFLALRAQHNENIVLIISILRNLKEDKMLVISLRNQMFSAYPVQFVNSIWVHENDGDIDHEFSRSVALREAAKLVPSAQSIIFHCDVDMLIRRTFLDRCRHNTILGKQVYYPVFYSLYPYANKAPAIRQRNGFWRTTSFGMTCMRREDFERVGAFEDGETRFRGWGSEDVFQFERVRNASGLVAFRAVEPGLLHRWHSKKCDVRSEAYVDCMKTNLMTMGDPVRVGPILLESLKNVDGFFERLQYSDEASRKK